MNINIRNVYDNIDVNVEIGNTKIDLGFMGKDERQDFLKSLHRTVIDELTSEDHEWWLDEIKDEINRSGYKLEEE